MPLHDASHLFQQTSIHVGRKLSLLPNQSSIWSRANKARCISSNLAIWFLTHLALVYVSCSFRYHDRALPLGHIRKRSTATPRSKPFSSSRWIVRQRKNSSLLVTWYWRCSESCSVGKAGKCGSSKARLTKRLARAEPEESHRTRQMNAM